MYYYVLKFPIFRHQFFSLLLIGICLIALVISESIFQKDNISLFNNYSNFILLIVLIIIELFFLAALHTGDKYLMEFNLVKPCNILIFESLSGLFFSFIALLEDNPFIKLKTIYDKESGGSFTLFIFLLFCYLTLSGLFNIYRLEVNKLYSPMAESLSNYFLNPLFMIYYYISGDDFIINGDKNLPYFIITVFFIVSLEIISQKQHIFSKIIINNYIL